MPTKCARPRQVPAGSWQVSRTIDGHPDFQDGRSAECPRLSSRSARVMGALEPLPRAFDAIERRGRAGLRQRECCSWLLPDDFVVASP